MIVFKPPPPKMQHTLSEGVSEGGRGREGEKEGGREGRESRRKEGREGEKEGGREGGRDIQYMHTHLHQTQICTHSQTLTGE